MKCLSRNERDFLVCSECAHFIFKELIDERYPMIKRGICSKFEKLVDNRWEIKCEDNTANYTCKNCIHFAEDEIIDEDDIGVEFSYEFNVCDITGNEIDLNDTACERFEK